jgi:hypothetical protein
MYCFNCGAHIHEKENFCGNCGARQINQGFDTSSAQYAGDMGISNRMRGYSFKKVNVKRRKIGAFPFILGAAVFLIFLFMAGERGDRDLIGTGAILGGVAFVISVLKRIFAGRNRWRFYRGDYYADRYDYSYDYRNDGNNENSEGDCGGDGGGDGGGD